MSKNVGHQEDFHDDFEDHEGVAATTTASRQALVACYSVWH